MNPKLRAPRSSPPRVRQSGAALVVGLILLLVLTVLAISGMATSALELLMAGNAQYEERAFQAADAGIEQALSRGIYDTNTPTGTYDDVTGVNPVPIRGTGNQINNCPEPDDPEVSQECEYFQRFDLQAGQTPVPGGGYSIGTGFEAYHFVVDSFGTAERGAQSNHQQSFYVVGPGGN